MKLKKEDAMKNKTLNDTISAPLNIDDKKRYKQLADSCGISLAEWIREACIEKACERKRFFKRIF